MYVSLQIAFLCMFQSQFRWVIFSILCNPTVPSTSQKLAYSINSKKSEREGIEGKHCSLKKLAWDLSIRLLLILHY